MELRGQALGITYSRGRTITSNPHLAHEAAEFAADYGDPTPFHRRMFKAYFDELEDIGQLDTVVRLGVEAGLPEAALRVALESGRYRVQVDDALHWARQIGVTGVPTFVFDEKHGVVGAQDHEVFVQVMEQLGRAPRSTT
jgi:predicted DsbA family dithiol-disulfide isomerase